MRRLTDLVNVSGASIMLRPEGVVNGFRGCQTQTDPPRVNGLWLIRRSQRPQTACPGTHQQSSRWERLTEQAFAIPRPGASPSYMYVPKGALLEGNTLKLRGAKPVAQGRTDFCRPTPRVASTGLTTTRAECRKPRGTTSSRPKRCSDGSCEVLT